MRHLNKFPNGFSLSQVKFIASQLVLAFECLHENNIVHRDLKPENVLLDEEGYIKLADFGLAKDLTDSVGKGSCGTLEYMAPEIVTRAKTHNYEVDWWTLGILMYELYYGVTPFLSDSREDIIENIKNKKLSFPEDKEEGGSKSLKYFKNVIKKLLKKDPEKRLGHSKSNKGSKKIKTHPFFKNVEWAKILDKTYESPYVPEIDTKKVKKYLKNKGCKIGVNRKGNDHLGKLAETDLPRKVRKAVDRNESIFT
jgi:serine/threonine protein kinase